MTAGRKATDPVVALDAAYEQVRNADRTRDYPAGREKSGREATPLDLGSRCCDREIQTTP